MHVAGSSALLCRVVDRPGNTTFSRGSRPCELEAAVLLLPSSGYDIMVTCPHYKWLRLTTGRIKLAEMNPNCAFNYIIT